MNARLLLLLAVASLSSACALPRTDAAPATPQRPLVALDTNTTAFGTFELEGGAAIDPGDRLDTPLLLKYGATPATELTVGWSPLVHLDLPGDTETGAGDVRLGIRHRMWDEMEGSPAVGVLAEIKVPAADVDRGLGTGEVDAALGAIATRTVRDVAYTGFYRLEFIGEPTQNASVGHTLALAAAAPIIDEFSAFGEISGFFIPETDSDQVQAILGAGYSLFPSIVFDAAVAIGLSEEAPDFQILFGFTTNLGLWRTPETNPR